MKASKPPKMQASLRELYLNNTANHVMDFSQSRPIRDARWLSDRRDSFTFGLIFSSWIRFWRLVHDFHLSSFQRTWEIQHGRQHWSGISLSRRFTQHAPVPYLSDSWRKLALLVFFLKRCVFFFLIFRPSNQNNKKKTTQRRLSSALRNERGVN